MFTIIKTYKSVFLGLIRSEFGRHLEWGYKNQDVTEDDNGSQLDEHVQELIKNWKIDEKDLKTLESIKGDMSKLEVQTQADLKEYLKNMTLSVLQNWFKIKWQEWVDALTRIAELTGDTELLSRINWIDFKLIDGKTIVKEENTFIVYDKEWDREGFLYNDRISTARRPWDNNDIYNDNKINIKTDKVDWDIDSILSSNETYKESNDKVKKVDKEQKAIDKHNTEIMWKMFKLLKIDISKLNMTQLDDLSTELSTVSPEVLKIHPWYKIVHLPKIEAKIWEINAEKLKVTELVKEKSDLEWKIKLFIQNNIDEPLDQTKLDAWKEEIDALNIKLKEKWEKPIDFKKIVKPQIKDLFDNMWKIQDIQILERVTEKSNNLVKILKWLGMNPNLINTFIIKFNKKYESVKDKINQIKVIKQQTKQKKVDKIKKTSTVEPNNIETTINTDIYTVVSWDTFWKIAKRAWISINELKAINPDIKNISKIYVGQKINIIEVKDTVKVKGTIKENEKINKGNEKVKTIEKAEQINIEVKPYTKDDIIKALKDVATHNWNEQKITTYSYMLNGEKIEWDINLYSFDGKLKVELDWTGHLTNLFDDVDTEIDGINKVKEWINKIVTEYQSEINKDLKEDFDEKQNDKLKEAKEKAESFPRNLGVYRDFDWKEQNIILKDVSHPWISDEDLDTPEYLVELDNSGKFIDPDISFDHIPNNTEIEEAKSKLLKEYNNEKEKKDQEQDKKDWDEAQEEFDKVDIWETKFDKEIEERGLEKLWLSENDIKILEKTENVHIDLSNIEKQDDWSYLIDIDGPINLVVKKEANWYSFTSDSGDFIFTDETVDNMKDAIISWTKQLNEYENHHKKENIYDPTKVTRKR